MDLCTGAKSQISDFFHVFKSSICKAFCAAWSKLCLKEKWQEFYMLSSSKLFQILPLCYATVNLSQILLRKERSKRGYTNITQLPPICLEKTQLCSAAEMPPRAMTLKDFINCPVLQEAWTPMFSTPLNSTEIEQLYPVSPVLAGYITFAEDSPHHSRRKGISSGFAKPGFNSLPVTNSLCNTEKAPFACASLVCKTRVSSRPYLKRVCNFLNNRGWEHLK